MKLCVFRNYRRT